MGHPTRPEIEIVDLKKCPHLNIPIFLRDDVYRTPAPAPTALVRTTGFFDFFTGEWQLERQVKNKGGFSCAGSIKLKFMPDCWMANDGEGAKDPKLLRLGDDDLTYVVRINMLCTVW